MTSHISFPGANNGLQIGINNGLVGISDPLDDLPIAAGAAFDSFENQHQDECLPGTRVNLLAEISEWATSLNQKSIFWLHGRAGTGKSSIARTLARSFKERSILGASFFFKRGEQERGDARRFITTIVRQLADGIPGLAPLVKQAINDDKNIATKGLKEQFDRIFLNPLRELKPPSSSPSLIHTAIVIDALDECTDDASIRLILQQLPRLQEIKALQMRVLLTSRPDWPALQGFADRVLAGEYNELILHQVHEDVIKDDITLFLKHRLQAIQSLRGLPPNWPGDVAVEKLATISVPLFIFAATVCRLFEDIRWDPVETLTEILCRENEVSLLESTYRPVFDRILEGQPPKKKPLLVRNCLDVIGPIVLLESPLSVTSLAKLLGLHESLDMSKSKIRAQLALLGPVLDIPNEDNLPIRLFHLSLRDFLLEAPGESFQRPFWVNESQTHKHLTQRCLETCGNLRRNICNLSDDTTPRMEVDNGLINASIPSEIQYACRYWAHHLMHNIQEQALLSKVLSFLQQHLLHWIEVMSILGLVFDAVNMIHRLQIAIEGYGFSELTHILHEANRFLLKIHQVAHDAPLQIYSAGLLFTPGNSTIRQIFRSDIPLWAVLISGFDEEWSPELQTLEGHGNAINAVTFSPDGRMLASASDDGTVILWHPRTGEIQQKLANPRGFGTGTVEFSHDSKLIVVGSGDSKVHVWDVTTSTLLHTLQESDEVWSVGLSPKEHVLATGLNDCGVGIWDIRKGTLIRKLKGHQGAVATVAFSPDGTMVASGSDDYTTRLWNLAKGSTICTLNEIARQISSVAFSSDGRLLVCRPDGDVEIWDTGRRGMSQSFKCYSESGRVGSMALSPSNRLLAACDDDVQIWDIENNCVRQAFIGHSSYVGSVAFSPNGQILASGSDDRSLRLWDMTVAPNHSHQKHPGKTKALSFSPDGRTLALVTSENTVRLYSAATGNLNHTLAKHSSSVSTVAFSPTSKQLASGSVDQTIALWDVVTGKLDRVLKASLQPSMVRTVVFSEDGLQLASVYADGLVRIWNIASGRNKNTFKCGRNILSIAFSPCGQLLAAGGSRMGWLRVWNIATGAMNFRVHDLASDARFSVAFSPDSLLIAAYDLLSRSIELRDSTTGKLWDTLVESQCNAEHGDPRNISYASKGLGVWRISVREGKIVFQPSDLDLRIWLTKAGWLVVNDRRILRLPPDVRPSLSAFKLDNIALGYPSGRVSLIRLDVKKLASVDFDCPETQKYLNEMNMQMNLQDNSLPCS